MEMNVRGYELSVRKGDAQMIEMGEADRVRTGKQRRLGPPILKHGS